MFQYIRTLFNLVLNFYYKILNYFTNSSNKKITYSTSSPSSNFVNNKKPCAYKNINSSSLQYYKEE